ncbi:MAG: PE-PPE domain-containing protein [Mycobacterium sp.]|uniref:PE family protein n=1 Tax=Mycobacterium sp. TaxID=1785 RepID=UPI001EB14584|nr:PE-PPE domain-containing protein [Mycobacterium sp.]MBW0017678.1 PE-PPE domain-containing protein [Mycobacterium sp.]
MTFVTVPPHLLVAAAADVTGIGSVINDAAVAAAEPTTGVVPAASDEVSTATSTLFGAYAQDFQAMIKQASAFRDKFAQALSSAFGGYTETEAANAAANVTLVMGGSGNPIPPLSYVNAVVAKYITPNFPGFTVADAQALFTPEAFYPLTGIKDLVPNVSVARGVTILDNAIQQQLSLGNHVAVLGFSQSSIIASLEMENLDPSGTPSSLPVVFTLLGDPMNPNGGLLARFPGLTMPSLGFTFYGATPDNDFPTNIYTIEYDGFADFPQYPINVLADLNALAGIYYVHGTYADLTPGQINSAIPLTNTVGPTLTHYYMIPNPHLPLLEPLRAIPVVGNPVADLLEPDMRILVNLGYGSPDQGWSTGPPNVPTSFGLFPPINAGEVLGDLATGTQQGIGAFVSDVGAQGSGLSLSGVSQPLSVIQPPSLSAPPSIPGVIGSLQATNTSVTNAISSALSTGYSVLLPTTDFGNAALVSVPSYDANLFLNGILQAVNGDPAGVINAVGDPIAADTALFTIAGGFEAIVLVSAAESIVGDFASI